jgi:hypothetical protein
MVVMAQHAKTPYRSVIDPMCVFLTLLLAYLRVIRNVRSGKHAWKPLPEIDSGATVEFAAVLHGWNADPPTERFGPVWPVTDEDATEEVTV